MNTLKKIIILFLTSLLVFSLVSCTKNTLSTRENEYIIKVIVKKSDHDFWAVVKMGAEAAGKEFNVTIDFDGPTDEEDIDGQIRMVEAAINNNVDALVLAASDFIRLVPVAEKAKDANIPVIIIDSNIDSANMDSFIGTDNVDGGRKLGESLISVVGNSSNIVIVNFVKGAASATERESGLLSLLDDYPGITILETVYCNSDEQIATQMTLALIKKYPQLDTFVCLNAYATVGVARGVVGESKEGDVLIIGFDSTPEEISFLEKDVIQSLVVQNPFSMGYLGVKYAIAALNNESVPKTIKTDFKVINKENMYLPENQKLVFPFVD